MGNLTRILDYGACLGACDKILVPAIVQLFRKFNQFLYLYLFLLQYTFNVIVKQVLGLRADEPQTKEILQDFLTFMRGLISLPIYIPGTPYARAVKVVLINQFLQFCYNSI